MDGNKKDFFFLGGGGGLIFVDFNLENMSIARYWVTVTDTLSYLDWYEVHPRSN